MPERTCSAADLELFSDLDVAARATGVEPCLIGAGAIRMGADLKWGVRLSRQTLDWDFAVRVASWVEFRGLAERLTSANAAFQQGRAPHRFRHRAGGTLDVIPYGAIEDPHGRITWDDQTVMETLGFEILDDHRCRVEVDHVQMRIASMPVLLGLKLLAYRSRRPAITRDISDVHSILCQVDAIDVRARIDERALERLGNEDVRFDLLGSYLLGREVGSAFSSSEALEPMQGLLRGIADPQDATVGDILRSADGIGTPRESVVSRFAALRLGIDEA